jgi:hypothetical protein
MTLNDLQVLIGSLTNDPVHDRYSTVDINTELDNSQDKWNVEAKIIRETTTITVVDGTRQYLLSLISGTPLSFPRTTHKGLDLKKRSKSYFDLYNLDWTTDIGTPKEFCIEATDPSNLYLTLHPTPQSGDAGANLVVEAIIRHTPMSLATDVPFMLGALTNYLLRPYDWGLGYEAAARLLARDPSVNNTPKAANYASIARNVMADVIQVFKNLEAEEPRRLMGGRNWNSGNIQLAK